MQVIYEVTPRESNKGVREAREGKGTDQGGVPSRIQSDALGIKDIYFI